MVIAGRLEESERNSCIPCLKSAKIQQQNYCSSRKCSDSKPKMGKLSEVFDNWSSGTFIGKTYAPLIMRVRVQILVALLFVGYMTVSIWGLLRIEEGLDFEKLLIKSDPIAETLQVERRFFTGGNQIEIAFVNAPDLTKAPNRKRKILVCLQ